MYAWPAAAGPKPRLHCLAATPGLEKSGLVYPEPVEGADKHDAINKEDEWIVLAKTLPTVSEKAKELVLSIHSYELPCILEFIVSTTPAYHGWVSEQVA